MDGCGRIYEGSILTRLEEGFGWAVCSIVQVVVRLNEHCQVLAFPLKECVTLPPPFIEKLCGGKKVQKTKFTGPEIFVF